MKSLENKLHTSEVLRQVTTMVDSLATHNKELETQIFQLTRIPLGPTRSGKQVKDYRENDKKVEESSGEEKVEIEKNSPTPPKRRSSKR